MPEPHPSSTVNLAENGPLFEIWSGTGTASMRIDWTRKGAVRITVSGHGAAGFSPPAIARWDAANRTSDRGVVLIDFWDMPTYDSGMRVQMTGWALKHRSDTTYFVTTRSKIVLMGLAVANLALDGILNVKEKRADFDSVCVTHGLPTRGK
jgi:hypothetical protein